MKRVIIACLMLLLLLSIVVIGCKTETAQDRTQEKTIDLTDQEILTSYPDDLDAALEELNILEE